MAWTTDTLEDFCTTALEYWCVDSGNTLAGAPGLTYNSGTGTLTIPSNVVGSNFINFSSGAGANNTGHTGDNVFGGTGSNIAMSGGNGGSATGGSVNVGGDGGTVYILGGSGGSGATNNGSGGGVKITKASGDVLVQVNDAGLGFFTSNGADQPTTAISAASFVANSGTAINNTSTFNGYTIGQIVSALQTLGLLR